jgi:acyl carrier protein
MDTEIRPASTAELVTDLIAEQFALPLPVDIKQKFAADLAADSLHMSELAMNIEDRFGVAIEDFDLEHVETVADCIALVERVTAV